MSSSCARVSGWKAQLLRFDLVRLGMGAERHTSSFSRLKGLKSLPTQLLEGPYEPAQLPAQMIQPKKGRVVWLADPSAGGMLAPKVKRAV